MDDPLVIASLFAATGPLTAAIFVVGQRLNNRKKNNPGIEATLARIDQKLNRLETIEDKLDRLLRG